MFTKNTEISQKLLFEKFFETVLIELRKLNVINLKLENPPAEFHVQEVKTLNKKYYDDDSVVGQAFDRLTYATPLQLVHS